MKHIYTHLKYLSRGYEPVITFISLSLCNFEATPNSCKDSSSKSLKTSPSTHSLEKASLYWGRSMASKSFSTYLKQHNIIIKDFNTIVLSIPRHWGHLIYGQVPQVSGSTTQLPSGSITPPPSRFFLTSSRVVWSSAPPLYYYEITLLCLLKCINSLWSLRKAPLYAE